MRVFSTVQRMSLENCIAQETLSESKKQKKKMKARCRALGKRRGRRAPLQIAQGHQRVTEAPGASAGNCRGSGGDEFHAGQRRTKEKPSCKEKNAKRFTKAQDLCAHHIERRRTLRRPQRGAGRETRITQEGGKNKGLKSHSSTRELEAKTTLG